MGTSVASPTAISPFLQPEETVSIEQANSESATGDPEYLADRSDLIFKETEGGNGHDHIRAPIRVWERTCVSDLVRCPPRIALTRIPYAPSIDVSSHHLTIYGTRECTREEPCATTNIEQGLSRAELQVFKY
jgi:hypothetical protein